MEKVLNKEIVLKNENRYPKKDSYSLRLEMGNLNKPPFIYSLNHLHLNKKDK